jgi:arylsulfatase A-like enzyme
VDEAALIDADWKLIARPGGKRPELSTPELFNLAADPFETLNLAADRPDQVSRLEQLLAAEKLSDLAEIPADLAADPEAGSH